ncbi:MAG: peptide chain release factor N(5)-glutamine methyltransferase [Gammaproteobacteria bacterium]|jgi:release factor glutamine methyltransferase|nr:peptide chain release factor N(5)-glutamine methyltransferase [Gammaproteobacteria bacterium]MDH5172114.1 peptide chain release factor N(5)-glutamine methyltransferase [Gammaproteobacteria bacterium]
MATVQELLRSGDDLPGDSARRDAEILLCHSLGKPRSWLYTWPEREVPATNTRHFHELLAERRRGQPVAYLVGRREFWSLSLAVNRHTLIPRPETETLVSWALELDLPADARVLDLGTGSGAIALALASERPGWQVSGVDASEEALAVAGLNAASLALERVRFSRSDWYRGVAGQRFHLLVSNPPYIDGADPHLQRGDVRFEPPAALVAADAGLADIAQLAAGAPAHLQPGGWLLLEHGYSQGEAVRALLRDAGFGQVATRTDLAGLERITGGVLSR